VPAALLERDDRVPRRPRDRSREHRGRLDFVGVARSLAPRSTLAREVPPELSTLSHSSVAMRPQRRSHSALISLDTRMHPNARMRTRRSSTPSIIKAMLVRLGWVHAAKA